MRAIYFLPQTRETRIVERVARKNRVRKQALQPGQPATGHWQPTLRPRVTKEAAITRLRATVPDTLMRRHKAGLEQLIDEMSREFIDDARITHLVALAELECGP